MEPPLDLLAAVAVMAEIIFQAAARRSNTQQCFIVRYLGVEMNIGDLSDDDMHKVFLLYCAKLMLQAKKAGHSMAILDVDPKAVFGIPTTPGSADAGLLTIAVAGGPSREQLQQAIELVGRPH